MSHYEEFVADYFPKWEQEIHDAGLTSRTECYQMGRVKVKERLEAIGMSREEIDYFCDKVW